MRKYKGLCTVIVLALAVSLLAGCGYKEKITVDVAGRSLTNDATVYFGEADIQMLEEMSGEKADLSQLTQVTLNGKTYYAQSQKASMTASDLAKNGILLDNHRFVQYINAGEMEELTAEELEGMMPEFAEVTYHFSKTVVKTNGTLLADGKSVVFDPFAMKGNCFYAEFDTTSSNIRKMSFSGVKNKACYNKAKTVSVKTSGIVTDILVNGKSAPGVCYYTGTSKSGKLTRDYVTLTKDGKYKVTAVLSSGAKKTISVTIDKKKPTANVKNNKKYKRNIKVTFTDKLSGVKKATLNGKKIKSGYKIKKQGSYKLVVTDKAGNVSTVKFKVK